MEPVAVMLDTVDLFSFIKNILLLFACLLVCLFFPIRIMIIINLTILHRGSDVGRVLGTPTQMDLIKVVPNGHSGPAPVPAQPPPSMSSNPPVMASKPFHSAETGPRYGGMAARPSGVGGGAFGGTPATTPPSRSPMGGSSGGRGNIYPIAGLNPYQNK